MLGFFCTEKKVQANKYIIRHSNLYASSFNVFITDFVFKVSRLASLAFFIRFVRFIINSNKGGDYVE